MKKKKLLSTISTITLSLSLLLTSVLPTLASEVNQPSISQQQTVLSTKTIKPTKITLNCKTITLNTGSTTTLIPTISPTTATNKSVKWKSSNTKIATINSEGLITAIKAGKSTITVTTVDNRKTAKCIVTVKTIPIINVTNITIDAENISMNVGDSDVLTTTITPDNATNQNVTWNSSDESIVTVNSEGEIEGLKSGKATITATTVDGKKTAKCVVTVKANDVNPIITFKDVNLEEAVRDSINKPSGDLFKSDVQDIISLNAYNREIVDINGIENLINLNELDLRENMITDISSLKGLIKLIDLKLGDNEISDISSLKGLIKLENLELISTKVINIDALKGLTNLTNLRLWSDNSVTIDISPLKGLTNLKDLELFEIKVSDISPLAGLTNLTYLDLDDNEISDINPLKKLTNLRYLSLRENPINDIDKQILQTTLPNCNIQF